MDDGRCDSGVSVAASVPAASEDPKICPICLESIKQEAYLDRCFHTFCHQCIANWTRYVTLKHSELPSSIKCPLCKTENLSIIHGLAGNSFQRQFVNQPLENGFLTKAHKFRQLCYEIEPGTIYSKICPSSFWKGHRYLQPNRFLQDWLRREIQSLLQDEDVDVIMYHVLGVIESFFKRQAKGRHLQPHPDDKRTEFKKLVADAARPFLSGRTDRFVDELELFLTSGLTLEAYDTACMEHLRLPCEIRV